MINSVHILSSVTLISQIMTILFLAKMSFPLSSLLSYYRLIQTQLQSIILQYPIPLNKGILYLQLETKYQNTRSPMDSKEIRD